MKGISYMEELIRQLAEATRTMEVATTQINEQKARIHDLEVENKRLRDHALMRIHQYHELAHANHALAAKVTDLESRIRTNRERIRRMEEGEL